MEWLDRDAILRSLGTAVLVCDPSGRIALTNPRAEEVLGRRAEELVGHWATEVLRSTAIGEVPWLGRPPVAGQTDLGPRRLRIGHSDGTVVVLDCHRRDSAEGSPQNWCVWELREVDEAPAPADDLGALRFLGVTARTIERLGSRPGLETVLRTTADVLISDFQAACVRVWMLDGPEGRPVLRARVDQEVEQIEAHGPGCEEEDGCPGAEVVEAALKQARFLSEDVTTDPRVASSFVRRHGLSSLCALPLQVEGEPQGVLAIGLATPLTPAFRQAIEGLAAIISAALKDVELIRREEAVRQAADSERERFQTIVDLIPAGIALAEGDEGRLTLLNPAGRRIWGLAEPPGAHLGFHDRAALQSADGRQRSVEDQPLWRALHRGERVHETLRHRQPDGRERILEVQACPFPGPHGAAIATFHDITDRVELQNVSAERAAQLKALLDHLPVGVAYFDQESYCRACNQQAWRILGRSRSQMIGAQADELFSDSPGLAGAVDRCVAERRPFSQSGAPWMEGGAGGTRFLDWRFEPLPVDSAGRPQGALALITDATDQKRADDELRAAKESAEQSARNKARFLSAISHDLRTPVNALNLLSRIVSDRSREFGPASFQQEMNELTLDLRRSAANLVELVNDLLDVTRFDCGEVTQHPVDFSLSEWLDSVLGPLTMHASQQHLGFRWHLETDDPWIRADRVKLGRILTNLVGNALKFTDEGEIHVRVALVNKRSLFLSVRDTGPGIPADQQPQIWDEFAQLRNPARDRTKGTGLGLAICRRLVEAAGGQVAVTSEPGQGSVFSVEYPVEPPLAPRRESRTPSRSVDIPDELERGAVPVLLVEDDPVTRKSMSLLLQDFGWQVTAAEDGVEALEVLATTRPAAVLLDLMMPGIDGTEVLRRIRTDLGLVDLPVIILSGDVLDDRAQALQELGASATLAKPIDFEELRTVLDRHVGLLGAVSA